MGHRFYHPDLSVSPIELDGPQARHLLVTLRARAGSTLELFDGAGTLREATVVAANKKRCTLELGAVLPCPPPPRPAISVAVAPPKGNRQGWLVQKATELGVARLLALGTARGSVPPETVLERWRRVALEASKQCGRVWLPEVASASLDDLTSEEDAPLLVLDPEGEPLALEAPPPPRVCLAIGPEGGFSPDEAAALRAAGARPVAVAPHILRIETAVLIGVAQLLYAWGWGGDDGSV